MTTTLQSRIDRLAKSTSNVANAKNPAQREAAEKFLTQRAIALNNEKKEREEWLEKADRWINANMPEINTDETHTRNIRWLDRLHEYEGICKALESAWSMLMQSKAGEPA